MAIIGTASVPGSTGLNELQTRAIRRPDHLAFCVEEYRDDFGGESVSHRGPERKVNVRASDEERHTFTVQAERFDVSPAELGTPFVYVNVNYCGWQLTAQQAWALSCALQLAADEVSS
jgi:hypothetical protein